MFAQVQVSRYRVQATYTILAYDTNKAGSEKANLIFTGNVVNALFSR